MLKLAKNAAIQRLNFNRLTVRIFLGLAGVAILIGGFGLSYLINKVERSYVEIQAAANEQQAARVAGILKQELASGLSAEAVTGRLQESLVQNRFDNAGFLCLMGKNGKVLCHPDPKQIGTEMPMPPLERLPGEKNGINGHGYGPDQMGAQVGLLRGQDFGGSTHILYQQPVSGTDWVVAVHANFDLIHQRVAVLRRAILQAAIPTLLGIIFLGTLVACLVERQHDSHIKEINAALARRITERTEELAKTTLRYRSIFEGAASAIFLVDNAQRIIEVNRRAGEMVGCARSALCGKRFDHLFSKLNKEPLFCTVSIDEKNQQCVWEAKLKASGPTSRDVLVYETPIQEQSGTIIQAIVLDVTEKKLLEAELRQAQKLDAIGHLAGGIAHDFNNLLLVINGYGELAQKELPDMRCAAGSEMPCRRAKAYLSELVRAGRRANDLTGQLLAFSRKQALQPRYVSLNDIINGVAQGLRRILGERIHFKTDLSPNLWPVSADPTQIEQVIVNLAVNARDAMPEGGTLTVSTWNQPIAENRWSPNGKSSKSGSVMLSVADSGEGIPDDIKGRIFEPFFTTKEPGKGTGLGLAVVHGIVKQHQGEIEFTSRLQHGTTFRISLPRAEAEPVLDEDNDSKTLHRGNETVLVVEDDSAARTFVEIVLRSLGYKVLSAASADEALLLLDDGGKPVDMVLTDMVMPGLDVKEFSSRLARTQPELKIAYMTGYTEETDFLRGLVQRGATVLQKPFSPSSLSQTVRQVLDRESSRILEQQAV